VKVIQVVIMSRWTGVEEAEIDIRDRKRDLFGAEAACVCLKPW
jgi:hypothetical protein